MTDKVTITDVRNAGFCVKGIKRWWATQSFETSFTTFLREGITQEEALSSGDEFARLAVEVARTRIAKENKQ